LAKIWTKAWGHVLWTAVYTCAESHAQFPRLKLMKNWLLILMPKLHPVPPQPTPLLRRVQN